MILALALAFGMVGWALEVAHPVFFAREPVVVWTLPDEPNPKLFLHDALWPTAWSCYEEEGRLRWEADLRDAPLGIWIVCGQDCFSFLRVSEDYGLVEVHNAPPGLEITLGEKTHLTDSRGTTFFLVPSGIYSLETRVLGTRLKKQVHVYSGKREEVVWISASVKPTSSWAIPGTRIGMTIAAQTEFDLPFLPVEISLPPGWEGEPGPDHLFPVHKETSALRTWYITVPKDAEPGEYLCTFTVLGFPVSAKIRVAEKLPPLVVVGHWDVRKNELDLASPFSLTFERALWAASLLGQPVPYTDEIMTSELLFEILQRWVSEGG
jgi:hypothetical protein